MNLVVIIGNLTRDVDMKYAPTGTAISGFTVAVNETYKPAGGEPKQEVSFFDVVSFGKTAENCAEYIGKGSKVLVQGKLKQETWEKDGQKRSRIKIIANSVQFLSKKSDGNQDKQNEALPF